jgi:hypothetical protein
MNDAYAQVDSFNWRMSACANVMSLVGKWLVQYEDLDGGGRIKLDRDSIEARKIFTKVDEELHLLMMAAATLGVSAFHKDVGYN